AVDHGRAADRAALLVEDRRIAERGGRAAVAVELARHRRVVGGEVAGLVVAALLEDDDVEPGLGELGGHRRAAGARADDHDVGVEHAVAVVVLAGEHARRGRALVHRLPRGGHYARSRLTRTPGRS